MNGFALPSGREKSICYLKSFTTVLSLPLPAAHSWITHSLTTKCLCTMICTIYEDLLCIYTSHISVNFSRKGEYKMVKQMVKQLQIGGLSKFTEQNCVFLNPLPSPLTLTPHSTCIVGYRHLTFPGRCETKLTGNELIRVKTQYLSI